jgi:hypothetical protein
MIREQNCGEHGACFVGWVGISATVGTALGREVKKEKKRESPLPKREHPHTSGRAGVEE